MRSGDGPRAVLLPCFGMDGRHATALLGNMRPPIEINRFAGPQIVDGDADGLGDRGDAGLERELDHRRDFHERADGSAVKRRQNGIADQRVSETHDRSDLIALLIDADVQELCIGHGFQKAVQIGRWWVFDSVVFGLAHFYLAHGLSPPAYFSAIPLPPHVRAVSPDWRPA